MKHRKAWARPKSLSCTSSFRLLIVPLTVVVLASSADSRCIGTTVGAADSLEGVLQNVRQARGIETWEHLGEIVLSGPQQVNAIAGQMEIRFDGSGRFVRQFEGRISRAFGYDGEHYWQVDYSRTPRVLGAAESAIPVWRSWFHSGFWSECPSLRLELDLEASSTEVVVLRVTQPEVGAGGTVTLSRETWLPTQLQIKVNDRSITVRYDDHRSIGGLMVAHEVITEPSREWGSFDVGESQALVRADHSKYRARLDLPADFDVDPDAEPVLESKRSATGHLMIRPQLDGEDLGWFILDSGAGTSVLDPEVADALGLDPFGSALLSGIGGQQSVAFRQAAFLTLGPLTLDEPVFMEMDCDFITRAFGIEIVGVLGFDVFARTVLEMDLKQGFVSLHDSDQYQLTDANWQAIELIGNQPSVECTFEGGHKGLFMVDTGSNGTLSFHGPSVRELKLLEGRPTTDTQVSGFGGARPAKAGLLDYFEIGGQRFDQVQASFTLHGEGVRSKSTVTGDVGGQLLGPFCLVFDYPHLRMAFLLREELESQ